MEDLTAPYVLVLPDGTVAGYHKLSSAFVRLGELPKLPICESTSREGKNEADHLGPLP